MPVKVTMKMLRDAAKVRPKQSYLLLSPTEYAFYLREWKKENARNQVQER